MTTSNTLIAGENTDYGCARCSRDASEMSSLTVNSFGHGASDFDGLRETQNEVLIRDVSDRVMDAREAVRSGLLENVETSLKERSTVRQELMAQNAKNGMGLLMLAVTTDKVYILKYIAMEIKTRLGMALLAKHLQYKDDTGKPIMFYAAESSPAMFRAVMKLVKDTIGGGGLAEQLRHQCARGMNILMMASSAPKVFMGVRNLAEKSGCLEELMEHKDGDGRNWVLHAAKAGNMAAFQQDDIETSPNLYELLSAVDNNGWSGFMYAARVKNVEFLKNILLGCLSDRNDSLLLSDQLNREANDSSTLIMHAAIGGLEQYRIVCQTMREMGRIDYREPLDMDSVLLSWAAKGGDIRVLNAVAKDIKTDHYRDEASHGIWSMITSEEEKTRLLKAIKRCGEIRLGTSLFLSAIESGSVDMINIVLKGIKDLVQDQQVLWKMLCGGKENPLAVAAAQSVECFQATLSGIQKVVPSPTNGVQPTVLGLLLQDTSSENTPLCNAVLSEDPLLFGEALKQTNTLNSQNLRGKEILKQVTYAMRTVDKDTRLREEWISAMMLAKVLQAVKDADGDPFKASMLDEFVLLTVSIRAFDHVRELLAIGCDLAMHFDTLIKKIAKNETGTTECIMLAITASSNPFVESGIASHSIYEAEKRDLNHGALERLHHRIWDLNLELLDKLPRSVKDVGENLARGDSSLDSFEGPIAGKIKPSELLGFVVVEGMLEGAGQYSNRGVSRPQGCESPLAQAIRLGPRALGLLSEPLVMDYLNLKFNRTLPRWNSQNPFKRNINQALYSYKHQLAPSSGESDRERSRGDVFQQLLLLLQGWETKGITPPHRTVLPGLQFTLAGVMGKPSSYYVIPSIRMLFIVFNYLATIGVYLSCVSLESQNVPPNEWVFYVVTLSMAWREVLEFCNVLSLESSLEASIERYFYDKWNFLDVITLGLVFVAFVFRMVELFTGRTSDLLVAQFFMAATAPFLLSRLLFLAQASSALGPMTQVIFKMLKDLVQFSVVLLLVMVGFAVSFNALYVDGTVFVEKRLDDCNVNDHPVVEAFGTFRGALLTMFQSMLGNFDFDWFQVRYENADGEDCGSVRYSEFGVILLVMYLVITAVMLLNLLIAVLSTTHSEVHQNAPNEFQLARAKLILQSVEDVHKDALPPPFNMVKPILGMLWPVSPSGRWEIVIGTIHRMIFWFVMGLGALVITIILWIISIPTRAWKIYERRKDITSGEKGDESRSERSTRIDIACRTDPTPYTDAEIARAITKCTYGMDTRKDRLSPKLAWSMLMKGFNMLVPVLLATGLCLVVYPLLSIVLWLQGFRNVVQYVKQMQSKREPWERRQVDLGEEEWFIARTHAIGKNRQFTTANSSIGVFNVNTLLKTTTGMTMEDLRQNMANRKYTTKRRGSCHPLAL